MHRLRRAGAIATLACVTALFTAAPAAEAAWPNRIAAMGDSITEAVATCGSIIFCQENSWSTGTNSDVNSHYQRILAVNQSISGNRRNFAVRGEKAEHLPRQANSSVSYGAQYVTILMGANDACTATPEQMTPVSTYKAYYQQAMDILRTGLPNAKVMTGTTPNLYRLWEIGHHNPYAVWRWNEGWDGNGLCQSMLKNPTSHSAEDEARRQFVLQRVRDYNDAVRDVCATWSRCRFDGYRFFNYPFTTSQISGWDYYHPSVFGQATISAEAWQIVTADRWLKGS